MDHTKVSGENVSRAFKQPQRAWPKGGIIRYPKTSIFMGVFAATVVAFVVTGFIGTYANHGLSFKDLTQLNWKVYVIGSASFIALNLLLMGIHKVIDKKIWAPQRHLKWWRENKHLSPPPIAPDRKASEDVNIHKPHAPELPPV